MDMPAGKEMSFAQFVLNDIEQNGAILMNGFMDSEFVIPTRLQDNDERFDSGHWMRLKSRTHKDDWHLYTGWDLFGHWARIIRGPDHFLIKVRGAEALALRNVEARLYAERKARKNAAKAERKRKELDAQWWP